MQQVVEEIQLQQDLEERKVDALCNFEILAANCKALCEQRGGGAISTSSMLNRQDDLQAHASSPNPRWLIGDDSGCGSGGGGGGSGGNLPLVHVRKESVSLAQARSLTFS